MILFNWGSTSSIILLILFVVVVIFVVGQKIQNLIQYLSNNRKQIVTQGATITNKQSKGRLVQNRQTGQQEFSEHYLDFKCGDNQIRRFKVKKDILFNQEVGDSGQLKYQGTRFLEFHENESL